MNKNKRKGKEEDEWDVNGCNVGFFQMKIGQNAIGIEWGMMSWVGTGWTENGRTSSSPTPGRKQWYKWFRSALTLNKKAFKFTNRTIKPRKITPPSCWNTYVKRIFNWNLIKYVHIVWLLRESQGYNNCGGIETFDGEELWSSRQTEWKIIE